LGVSLIQRSEFHAKARRKTEGAKKITALPALLLPPRDFFMRRFRQTRHAFRFGFALTGRRAGFVAVMLMHLFLMLVEIEFVQARARTDLVSLDVPCLTFHDCSLRWPRLKCPTNVSSPFPFGRGPVCALCFAPSPNPPKGRGR